MHGDPIMVFILYPIAIFYLAFLEGCDWVRANSDGGEHDKTRHTPRNGNSLY